MPAKKGPPKSLEKPKISHAGPNARSVFIVAGEASADLHGANLVKALQILDPSIKFLGVGGRQMQAAGVRILFSASEMAVVGLTEAAARFATIVKAARRIKAILKHDPPDLLILIDYPEFNLHISRTAKLNRVPVLYYISPQVWAWRRRRVKKIARRVDRLAVIFPFEETFYRRRGLRAEYVGHPLLDTGLPLKKEMQSNAGRRIENSFPVVGLLPGSRNEEVRNLLPAMLKAAEIMARRYPGLNCRLPLAETVDPASVNSFLADSALPLRVIRGNTCQALNGCHLALVTSGTATLETAIMEIPMVVVYRVSAISYWAGRILVKVSHISLVNLVAEEEAVPELIQNDVAPERIAAEAVRLLEEGPARKQVIEKLRSVRKRLGKGGASQRTAEIALEMIKERGRV
jgi:lipid-A-disaccharide synthase